MSGKAIVLDANILIRAVLGKRVRELIFDNADKVKFFAPEVAYLDARKYLPALMKLRNLETADAISLLNEVERIVQVVDVELYEGMKQQALQRIKARDADDWPILACAMTMNCPIWTEDADFFGAGIATWTSDRVALYFS